MNYDWIAAVLSICLAAALLWMFCRRREWLVNFLLRACVGITLIYGVNMLPVWRTLGLTVGINPVTAGVAGVLGIPGIIVMYGMVLCFA